MDDSIVEIKYDRTGTTPPIFIAGTFTDWHPVELEPQQKDADYIFSRRFSVKPGTYQYKFRLGHGDWWVCDEAKQTETDAAGNVNNVLTIVEPKSTSVTQQTIKSAQPDLPGNPPLGLDGSSDKDDPMTLRKAAALTENSLADLHGCNGNSDIEREGPESESAPGSAFDTHKGMKAKAETNGSISVPGQNPFDDSNTIHDDQQKDLGRSSDIATSISQHSDPRNPENAKSEEKALSQKSSVSTLSTNNGGKKKQGSWLIRFCRTIYEVVVGSILCGKRRKLFAVALTALLVPLIAWKLRS